MNKKRVSLIVFIIGIITLIAGVIFLIIKLNTGASMSDGDYLVSIGEWVEESADSVIWNFTEIGKGTLTTNNHLNDYDFTWSIEDKKLRIKTDWLYELDNEFEYELNQSNNTLIIINDEEKTKFIPLETE